MPRTLLRISLLCAYAVVAAALSAVGLPPLLAGIVLAPLVFFAPGAALVAALGIESDPEYPARPHLIAVALSMASVVLGGLLLNGLAALDATSWAIWLAAVTLVAGGCALLRARFGQDRAKWSADEVRGSRPRSWTPSARGLASGAVALLLLGGAAVLTETTSRAAYDKPVFQLSLLPLAPGAHVASLVVSNNSSRAKRLRLLVTRTGSSAANVVVTLGAGKSWSTSVRAKSGEVVGASLSGLDEQRPFAQVVWRVAGLRQTTVRRRVHRRRSRR